MSICGVCNEWFSHALLRLFPIRNGLPQETCLDASGLTNKLRALRRVDEIYHRRKSCWFCSRIWLMHRFDILGNLEYHSDDDIYKHFTSVSSDRRLAVLLEYHHDPSSPPDAATGTLLLTSESSSFFRVHFTVESDGAGHISPQKWMQYELRGMCANGQTSEPDALEGPRLIRVAKTGPDDGLQSAQRLQYNRSRSESPTITEWGAKLGPDSITRYAASSSRQPNLKTKSSAEVLEATRVIIANVAGTDVSAVQSDTFLSELGIDSLIAFDLAAKIEQAFGVSMTPYMIFNSRDVRRMASAVKFASIWSYNRIKRSHWDTPTRLERTSEYVEVLGDKASQIGVFISQLHSRDESRSEQRDACPVLPRSTLADCTDALDYAILDSSRTELVRNWIRDCDQHHSCRDMAMAPQSHDSVLPTRLVDVLDGPVARLVETASLPDPHLIRYATLSHCWGGEQSDMLLASNYASRLHVIVLSHLNNTSSDAIRICRRLGIRYIWIDSLCIIQDAKAQEDWLHEAPRMDQVYGNSFLNIAATVARSGRENIVHEPLTSLSDELEVKVSNSINLCSIDQPSRNILRIFKESPLTLRGWVQQELLISPRTLHFTDEQLIWGCRAEYRGEVTRDLTLDSLDDHSRMMFYCPLQEDLLGSLTALDKSWRDMAYQYSATSVTFDNDRYTALSGIARMFRRRYEAIGLKTFLIAGCWYHDLRWQINWLSKRTLHRPRYDKTYVPSWSWLSVEGKGFLFAENRVSAELCADLVDVDVRLKRPELEYGPLTKATITLRGPIVFLQAKVLFNWRYSPTTTAAGGQCLTSQMQGDIVTLSNGRGAMVSGDALRAGYNNCYFDRVPSRPWGSPFKCILTVASKHAASSVHQGLVLEEHGFDVDGRKQYQRIGCMNVYDVRPLSTDDGESDRRTPLQALLALENLSVEEIRLV